MNKEQWMNRKSLKVKEMRKEIGNSVPYLKK